MGYSIKFLLNFDFNSINLLEISKSEVPNVIFLNLKLFTDHLCGHTTINVPLLTGLREEFFFRSAFNFWLTWSSTKTLQGGKQKQKCNT